MCVDKPTTCRNTRNVAANNRKFNWLMKTQPKHWTTVNLWKKHLGSFALLHHFTVLWNVIEPLYESEAWVMIEIRKLTSVFQASVLSLIMNFVITVSKQLWIHEAIAIQPSGYADYFDNVVTKFIVYNRADAWKTDVHLFFTITNCQIVRSRALPHRINYKFMYLSVYWRWKLANKCVRMLLS